MGSTWEHLEFLLMQENMRQDMESQQGHSCFYDPHLGTQNHAQNNDDEENDFIIPTKSLREFLEIGERMFVDLEESVYDQLYFDLRHSTTPDSATIFTPPTSGTSLPRPQQQPRYISLALVFGTTLTTLTEQYMIRIGPLEPRLPSPSSSTPSNTTYSNHVATPPLTAPISVDEQARRTREEKKWDRLLIQNLMGIHTTFPTYSSDQHRSTNESDYSEQQYQQQQQQQGNNLLGTNPLRHRTKTHLLMRAPAGKIFTGMFPQQHLVLHQDYPTPSPIPSPFQMEEDGDQGQEVSATQSCWNQGCRTTSKKPARWPIHHIHIFGPSSSSAITSEQEQDSRDMDSEDVDEGNKDDEMWYLIGPGIPLLSPLL
ncbi:hypothetical protein BG015_011217 [Linnemannia schmuckeri]|uniref:Uncharacterized protein n=1 Tax=Linnemannia schmuckeri TaxID=64567 RepID=A0A9P5V820_9FUNG|nr:hypothetical protein BG015_011217 [Linnemannia schmuckeri]